MAQTLYISFWKIGLENLPDGTFRRRSINAIEAKSLITAVSRDGTVKGVTADDLFAPYKKRELKNHRALSDLLASRFGISLPLKMFACETEGEEGAVQFANPLSFATVAPDSSMLVISCSYGAMKPSESGQPLEFEIAPDSVTFHLFEAM